MRIMILSNVPWVPVGYGTLVKQLCRRLKPFHTLAISANYGVHGSIMNWEGIKIYPAGRQGFSEQLILEHARDFNCDVILSIYDMYALSYFPQVMRYENKIKWIAYSPVDTDMPNDRYLEVLKTAYQIIPMSQHGLKVLDEHFPDTVVDEIPGGVDTKIFKPVNKEEQKKLKKELGFEEDCFLVLFAGDSRWYRKNVAENLEGFKIFAENHKELKPRLYIHSIITQQDSQCYDIQSLVEMLFKPEKGKEACLDINKDVRVTEQYEFEKGGLSDEEMAKLYQAADVFLHVSFGEGIGLMTLEASACGTPAIYSQYTSQEEYSRGVPIIPVLEKINLANTRGALPHPESIADAILEVANHGKEYYLEECLKNAKQFDWDIIINDYWLPYFEILEKELKNGCWFPDLPKSVLPKPEIRVWEK